jgi:tyrosine-protein kinase Etk/Wzc
MTDKTSTKVQAIEPAPVGGDRGDRDFGPLDVLIMLARRKFLLLALPFVVALIAAGYSLTLPNIFTANTRILPPQGQPGAAAMLTQQLGGFAGLVAGSAALKNPNDLYVSMLRSRTVADYLNQRLGLLALWEIDAKYPSQLYERLGSITRISFGKDGVITIEVDDRNPKFAAQLANAYVDGLVRFSSVLAVTEGAQRRLFFERQLALAKDNLASMEVAARKALEAGGLSKVDEEGRAMVEASARLRGQITVKEVQIAAMRAYAAEGNPELRFAQQELDSMRHQLRKLEGVGGTDAAGREGNGRASASLGLLREYKYREAIVELLAKQYEMAKIDEAKDPSLIQVLDKAIEPDQKSSPRRSRIVMVSAFLALLMVILWVIVQELAASTGSDPERKSRLLELKRLLYSWK